MTAGILNPHDKDRSTASRPSETDNAVAERRWFDPTLRTRVRAQDLNRLLAQIRSAGDFFGVTDSEGDDTYLRKALATAGREKLTAARTYYVRSDGSDSNDGLSDTAGGAFLTVQKAINTVWNLNLNGQAVVIQSRLATCAEALVFNGPNIGNNTTGALVTLRGDTTTPANCVIQPASGSCITAVYGAAINVEGFKFVAPSNGLIANVGGTITITGACDFGACTTTHMTSQIGGRIVRSANITVSAASARHVRCLIGGHYEGVAGTTVTISGTPAFSTAFIELNRNSSYYENNPTAYSGSATGFKFMVDSDCSLRSGSTIIDMNSILPGDKLGAIRSVQTTPLQPMRNIVVNGDGLLQNGASGAVGDDVYGLHDRWYVLSQSGNVTPSTISDVANGIPQMIRLTNSHGSSQRFGYAQIVPSDMARRFRGKRLTAGLTARRSGTNNGFRVSILSWSGTPDALTSDIVNDWTSATFTVGNFFTNPAGLSVLMVAALSATNVDTIYDLTSSTFVADVPSDCNNLVFFVHNANTTSGVATDFRLQIEEGLQVSPFDLRAPQLERMLVRRRIQRKTVNSINGTIFVPLDEMAAAPTVTIVSGAGSVANATKDGFHLTHTSVASHDILCTAEL